MELTTPWPVELRAWLMMATRPEKMGASKLVPPPTVRLWLEESRRPSLQLAFWPELQKVVSLVQKAKGALAGEALREISGTMRLPLLGMATPPMVPVCQEGCAVKMLMPPPPEPSGLLGSEEVSSFQTISGM